MVWQCLRTSSRLAKPCFMWSDLRLKCETKIIAWSLKMLAKGDCAELFDHDLGSQLPFKEYKIPPPRDPGKLLKKFDVAHPGTVLKTTNKNNK